MRTARAAPDIPDIGPIPNRLESAIYSTFAIAFVLRLAFARRASMRDRETSARGLANKSLKSDFPDPLARVGQGRLAKTADLQLCWTHSPGRDRLGRAFLNLVKQIFSCLHDAPSGEIDPPKVLGQGKGSDDHFIWTSFDNQG